MRRRLGLGQFAHLDRVAAQVAWWLAHMGSDAIKMGKLPQAKAAAHIIETQLTSMSKM